MYEDLNTLIFSWSQFLSEIFDCTLDKITHPVMTNSLQGDRLSKPKQMPSPYIIY